MLIKSIRAIALAFPLYLGLSQTVMAAPILVYTNDFESGAGSVGPEWSGATWHAAHGISDVSAHLGDYLLSGSTTFTLTGLPAHASVSLAFDLYLFNTWDGENLTFGKDFFSLAGDVTFSTTFTNHQPEGQSYPGSADVNPGLPGSNITQIYYGLDPLGTGNAFLVGHSTGIFTVTFGGPTSQTDEQWGIDNVRVTVNTRDPNLVPEPTTFALVAAGLLGAIRSRRRNKKASERS